MAGSVTASFTPEYESVKTSDRKITFLAHLLAAPMQSSADFRPRISLSSVLDKSASMKGSKLELVKKASEFVINNLSGQDKIGCVTYDSSAEELIPLSKTSEMLKEEAKRVINAVESGSNTNLSGGLFMGIGQQSRSQFYVWDTKEDSADEPSSTVSIEEDAHSTAGYSFVDLGANSVASYTFSDASMVDMPSTLSLETSSIDPLQTTSIAPQPAASQPEKNNAIDHLRVAAASLSCRGGPTEGGAISRNFTILEACCSNNPSKLKALLEQGDAPPYFFSLGASFEGWTPLHFAALHGWTDIILLFTQEAASGHPRYQAALSAADRCGRTPLTLASQLSDAEPAVLLRAAGAAEKGAAREGAEEEERRQRQAEEEQERLLQVRRRIREQVSAFEAARKGALEVARKEGRKRRRLFRGQALPEPHEEEEGEGGGGGACLKHVFLLTDGLANAGITDAEKLLSTLQNTLQNAPGVCVSTFGVGTDHDGELLGRIARAGGGSYYLLKDEEEVPRAFADALGGLLAVAAQNVALHFIPAPGVVVEAVQTPFATTHSAAGGCRVQVGDLQAEEGKDILFTLQVDLAALLAPRAPSTAQPAHTAPSSPEGQAARPPEPEPEIELGHLEVSYLDVERGVLERAQVRCAVSLAAAGEGAEEERVGCAEVAVQRARVQAVRALERAQAAAQAGSSQQAQTELREAAQALATAQGHARLSGRQAAVLAHLAQDVAEAAGALLASRGRRASAGTGGELWATIRCHEAQRSSLSRSGTFCYASSFQLDLRSTASR